MNLVMMDDGAQIAHKCLLQSSHPSRGSQNTEHHLRAQNEVFCRAIENQASVLTMISHHHQTIFVHIPKCGGQSIEAAFLQDLGLEWENRAPLLLRKNDNPKLGPPRLAHLTAYEYLQYGYISRQQFERYFSFSLVRSPLERAVSLFNYVKHNLNPDDFFLGWLPFQLGEEFHFKSNPSQKLLDRDFFWFVQPQINFVYKDGAFLVDEIYRLENLAESLPRLRARSNLTSEPPHRNRSRIRLKREDLDSVHLEMIETLYEPDFSYFGYERPSCRRAEPENHNDIRDLTQSVHNRSFDDSKGPRN